MIGGSLSFSSDVIVESSIWLGDVLASVCDIAMDLFLRDQLVDFFEYKQWRKF